MPASNPTSTEKIDYVIIGAGPAGLQLGFYLERAGRSYVILESQDRAGTRFEQFPRNDKLISINKVYTGYTDRESQLRYDWNSLLCDDDDFAFKNYDKNYFPSSKKYAEYLRDYAEKFGLNIRYGTKVESVDKLDVDSSNGEVLNYRITNAAGEGIDCRVVVVAVGFGKPYLPEIPGIELTENYWDFSINPEDYADQRVLIIGKGNAAFETANDLTPATRVTHLCSPNPIKMAWKTHYFGHLRAVNNDFLDTYILKGQNSVLDADINKIEKVDGEFRVDITFSHADGQTAQFGYDRVLCCTGFRWDPQFFGANLKADTTPCGRLPKMSSSWESTNLPHIYYAGTLMQMRDQHKTMSNVLHGFRFNVKSLASHFEERYEGQVWPSQRLPRTAEAMAEKVSQRVSTNAGLMHQPGFLSDVMVVEEDEVVYYETLAVDYIRDSRFGKHPHYYIITMEYGDTIDDLLAVNREPDPNKAYNDFYLHPRVQAFHGDEHVGEHHIAESLENEWRLTEHPGERPLIRKIDFHGQDDSAKFQQTHRDKLIEFFQNQLDACGKNAEVPGLVAAHGEDSGTAS